MELEWGPLKTNLTLCFANFQVPLFYLIRICSTDNKQMLENGGEICYTIADGDPQKIIRKRFDDETIENYCK